jgi:1-pyrroline-5-carboxylate dehydrogenase
MMGSGRRRSSWSIGRRRTDRRRLRARSGALVRAGSALRTRGSFYINDKPTGAVVRTAAVRRIARVWVNKAGSKMNLLRWVSARSVKENFNPPHDYRYPFMAEE